MNKFSDASIKKLATCDPDLQMVIKSALDIVDFTVLCGHRTNEEQQILFDQGLTKAKPGESKHNVFPSKAVDLAPHPIDFKDTSRYYFLAGIIITLSKRLGIKIRWGGDWNMDFSFKDEKFKDLGHFELIG